MELKKLCEEYLDNCECCEKLQYLSKYDVRLEKEWLDCWVESIIIRQKMYDELTVTELFDEDCDEVLKTIKHHNMVKDHIKMLRR